MNPAQRQHKANTELATPAPACPPTSDILKLSQDADNEMIPISDDVMWVSYGLNQQVLKT